MKYYDSKGNLVELTKNESFSTKGTTANIYKSEDGIAYKKYFEDSEINISQPMFEILKAIDNPHFIKLIERYYSELQVIDYNHFIESISDTKPNYDFTFSYPYRISLYTYYWIQKESIDLLEEDKEYLLDNLNELFKLSNILSRNHVRLSDMKVENCICNKSGIVLIDPDLYFFVSGRLPFDKNRFKILYLVSKLCQTLTRHNDFETTVKIKELFSDCYDDTNKAVKTLSKKLRGYRRPIDYLNR